MVKDLVTARARAIFWDKKKKEIEKELIDLMETQDLSMVKTEGGPSASICQNDVKVNAYAKGGNNEAMQDALRREGAEHLIKAGVNNASLRAWVKERLRQGEEIPDEIEYQLSPALQVRKNGWSPDDE